MKTKEEIKNDYAVSKGYDNWISVLETNKEYPHLLNILIEEAMEIYAMECLKLTSNQLQNYHNRFLITNENNIIK